MIQNLMGDLGPHPSGSPEASLVADRIREHLEWLGYIPKEQQTLAAGPSGTVAEVRNVMARRSGTEQGPVILCVAHYDSVWAGPGVADDMAGVATLLETARAVIEGPRGRLPVVFLFTDAEEDGLVGAAGFSQHPLMEDVGVVLNLEARGGSGPSYMFETGYGNRWWMEQYGAAVKTPTANSLSAEIYARMPNDTDFSIFRDAGLPGFNFAFIEDFDVYHTPLDDLSRLSPDSLQHHGDQMLALVQRLSNLTELPDRFGREKGVFFSVAGGLLVRYGQVFAFWAALSALIVALLGVRRAELHGASTWSQVGRGCLWLVVMLIAPAVLGTLVQSVLQGARGQAPLWRVTAAGAHCITAGVLGLTWLSVLRVPGQRSCMKAGNPEHRIASLSRLARMSGCAAMMIAVAVVGPEAHGAPGVGRGTGVQAHDDAHSHRPHSAAGHPGLASFSSPRAARNTSAGRFSFVVVADTQANGAKTSLNGRDDISLVGAQIVSDIRRLRDAPGLVIFPGDLVGVGNLKTFRDWDQATRIFSRGHPITKGDRRLMVPGNHDLPGRAATNGDWQKEFSWLPDSQEVPDITTVDPDDTIKGIDQMDYYYDIKVNRNDLRFISVTTDRDYLEGERHKPGVPSRYGGGVLGGQPTAIDWFQSVMALDSTKNKDHVFVMTHHPITSSPFDNLGHNGNPPGGTAGEWWKSIAGTNRDLDSIAAAALFTGHMHMYQPSRPDPHSDTSEVIIGTGGGNSEGVRHRRVFGFMEVTVQGPNVSTRFYGDANGRDRLGRYRFTDILDEYIIAADGGLPQGELALYQFTRHKKQEDSSKSILSKGHELNFHGGAKVVRDRQRGDVLELTGNGFVDAKALGDNNLSVLRDLTIELAAKARSLDQDQSTINNVLVAFGDADAALTTGGGVNTQHPNDEMGNYAYILSYAADGHLRLAWEYFDDPTIKAKPQMVTVRSTAPVDDPRAWHDIRVERDAETMRVRFAVDGEQLGEPVAFERLPTGAGAGSLYLGASADGGAGAGNFAGSIDAVRISSAEVSVQ